MSLTDLRAALAALDEPAYCDGEALTSERLAIMLPDGDVAAIDDDGFVAWLVDHGELAPFGEDGETRVDPNIRDAIRLVARGDVRVTGFDPESILHEIEATLSPREHLVATLTDVLVYPPGGHFDRHKDTPTSPELIGTLIVELPIAHTGGEFEIDDGVQPRVIDWSGAVDKSRLRWVAMFSDVDHTVMSVESGSRVTLVYSLVRTDRDRQDPDWGRRFASVASAMRDLDFPNGRPIMIACTRHVIGADETPVVESIDSLRGVDREIAAALVRSSFAVKVRSCLVAREVDGEGEVTYARLAAQFTHADVANLLECVTFRPPIGDGGGYFDEDATNLEPFLADELPADNWIVRRTAAGTFMCARDFAGDAFIGNGAYGAFFYKLAALEVSAS